MSANKGAAGFQPAAVDRLIHEPARYGVMALLYVVRRAEFLFVQNQTGLTPGNLSAHASKLEQAGYLKVDKNSSAENRRPFSACRMPAKRLSRNTAGK